MRAKASSLSGVVMNTRIINASGLYIKWPHLYLFSYSAIIQYYLEHESHHKVNDLVFTHKILHGLIICPKLNEKFVFRNVPYPIRDSRPLLEHCSRSDYNFYSLINRCKRQWNTIPPELQICTNLTSFKNRVKSLYLKFY